MFQNICQNLNKLSKNILYMPSHSLHMWYQQKKSTVLLDIYIFAFDKCWHICFYLRQFHKRSYLKNGTGNPCVLHNISNPWPSFRKIILFLSSGSTVGALAPTGSKIKIFCWNQTCNNTWRLELGTPKSSTEQSTKC